MILSIGICLCQIVSFAAFDQQYRGARSAGLANASSGLSDFWAIYNNQAGLARLKASTFGLAVQNHYLLKDLNQGSLGIAIPVKKAGVIGLSFDDLGISIYRENILGLAYAKAFGPAFSAGMKLSYLRSSYSGDNGDRSYIGFELGILYRAKPGLIFAFHTSNPLAFKPGSYKQESLCSRIVLGMSHEISQDILILCECEKVSSRKARFKAGIEYFVKEKISLRAGILTAPFQFSFGFGYQLGNLTIDLASSYHRFLGFSPQISIHYTLSRK